MVHISFHVCTSGEYDSSTRVPTIQNPDPDIFYLVPVENGSSPDLFVEWVYTNNNWEMFGSATIDLSNYVQKTDYATNNTGGVVKVLSGGTGGFQIDQGFLLISAAKNADIKNGSITTLAPLVPAVQHNAAFYGLAKAAGDTTQSQSDNAVGIYTT